MEDHTAYDYRMYDHVWQRVSPGCNPYADTDTPAEPQRRDAAASSGETMSTQLSRVSSNASGADTLPGAQLNPCCMGSEAAEMIEVITGFIEEELAQRRCYIALSQRICHGSAARLLRALAQEKKDAAQELKTAYFLITGTCYETIVSIDHMRWNSLADALRTFYHQEACNGFNYRRAADETVDTCLEKLLGGLSAQSFARADALMALLGQVLC